jgi:hypothetical protein
VEDVGADGLGVSLITSGCIRTMAHAADERGRRLEDAQLVAGKACAPGGWLSRRGQQRPRL